MALAQEADVLLLDEPTAHLDPAHQRGMLERLGRLAHERGFAIVSVLHDLNLASAFASRMTVLAEGRIVHDGHPRAVLSQEVVTAVFGPGLRVLADGDRQVVLPAAIRT